MFSPIVLFLHYGQFACVGDSFCYFENFVSYFVVVVSLVVSSRHCSPESLIFEMICYVLSGTLNLCLYHES